MKPHANVDFDITTFPLPLDAVTIGDMRRVESGVFRLLASSNPTFPDVELLTAIGMETVLAERAFARARGTADPYPIQSLEYLRSCLAETYVKYGICPGPHEAHELVRSLEARAGDRASRMPGSISRQR